MLCCSGERYRAIMALLFFGGGAGRGWGGCVGKRDGGGGEKLLNFFLFLRANICYGYSLEAH